MFIKPLERIHPTNTHWLYSGTIRQHLKRYEFAKQFIKNKTVLDIACGYGYGSDILAEEAARVIGIDISDEAINSAKKEYSKQNIEFICGDASKIDLPDNSVDVAVSFETIEHLPKNRVDDYLAELRRVLKKDGKVIISSPDIRGFSLGKTSSNHFHEQEWTEVQFIELINKYFCVNETYAQELTPRIIVNIISTFALGPFSHLVQKLWRALRYWVLCSGSIVLRDINDQHNIPTVTLLIAGKCTLTQTYDIKRSMLNPEKPNGPNFYKDSKTNEQPLRKIEPVNAYVENFVPPTPDAANPITHPRIERDIKRYPDFEGELTPHVVQLLTELCFVPQDESPSDILFVMGGHLYLEEFGALLRSLLDKQIAPRMLITGGMPRYEDTASHAVSEADMLINLINPNNYPGTRFILEKAATNFKENVDLGIQAIKRDESLSELHTVTVVCEPSAAGRALMYFPKYMPPEVQYKHISFDPVYAPHTDRGLNAQTWTDNHFGVSRVIGEFGRIRTYGERGDIILTDHAREIIKEIEKHITLK